VVDLVVLVAVVVLVGVEVGLAVVVEVIVDEAGVSSVGTFKNIITYLR